MKKITPATSFTLVAGLAAACLLVASSLFAEETKDKLERQFHHVIPFELGAGASSFYGGNQITITAVRGDREHIEPGGSYLVEGTYTLVSADNNELMLYCTTSGPGGPEPVQAGERNKITRGTGQFYLYETNLPEGWLHVCFSSLHGNVYFGENGNEKTILRDHGSGSGSASKANHALIAYLGDPVPPPANMDAKYTKKGLSDAIQLAARNAGIIPKRIAIDDSEFPFLVGVICSGSDIVKLKAEIKKMDGYEYGGGVGNDSNSDGSDTCNTFCIVPYQAYPRDAGQQIYHRRTLRQEVFYEKLTAQQ